MKKEKMKVQFLIPCGDGTNVVYRTGSKLIIGERVIAYAMDDENLIWPVTQEGIETSDDAVGVCNPDGSIEMPFVALYESKEAAERAIASDEA